jgi:hypothetical protein
MTIPRVEGRRFTLGKYDIIAQPIPECAHMLRYTVFIRGKRLGALASMPSESDCAFLENPPAVPALVPWQFTYRPGRPKKGTPPRNNETLAPPPSDELPHGMAFPQRSDER